MTRTLTKENSLKENLIMPFWQELIDYLVPPSCPLCRTPLQVHNSLCGKCWREIDFITAPYCYRTGVPLPYEAGQNVPHKTISLPALLYPPPYERARAALYYEGAAPLLIRALKFYDRPEIATLLAQWMARAGQEFWQQSAHENTWIMPVPLHPRRLLWRRYNQAAELCRALAGYHDIPILFDGLVRVRPTRRQVGLTRTRRMRNLGRAFAIRPSIKDSLYGARVILIDDVITTGTTIEACAKILRRAGVAQIDVLAAARVVLPETYKGDL